MFKISKEGLMYKAFDDIWKLMDEFKVDMETAAYDEYQENPGCYETKRMVLISGL